ncbi:hypothetical protein ACLSU7_13025 [Bdellovibrio sp. HCB185ZH]|uniref:hypothetical protein n=1 Tax=Bdellovibrio sp. HCB185ZH TaxID=3394235 RepID=UPI0039A4EF40
MGWRLKPNKSRTSWSLHHIVDKGKDKNGKKLRPARVLADSEIKAHGFDPNWSYEAALKYYRNTFQAEQSKKREAEKMAKAKARINDAAVVKSAFLPDDLVQEFYQYLVDRFAHPKTGELPDNYDSFWRGTQNLIAEVQLEPWNYSMYPNKIYSYAVKHQYSPSWFKKILKFVNLWGFYVCNKRQKAFLPVPPLEGQWRNLVNESYLEVKKDGAESDPLTFEILESIPFTEDESDSEKMKGRHWRYMYCCLALGLRPSELDRILTDKKNRVHEITRPDKNGIQFLKVFQQKLIHLEPKDRWKSIPILYDQQVLAIEFLRSSIARPLTKTIHNFVGPRFGNYAGRKGFLDWLLSMGQKFENISMYLGHTSLDRSLRSYKKKGVVYYDVPEKKKGRARLKSA